MQTIFVNNQPEGIQKAKEILYEKVDRQSLLLLSGGKSPKELYEKLDREQKLRSGAAAMVDERYGSPMHENSNENMFRRTGLLDYFEQNKISWYPILHNNLTRTKTAEAYEAVLEKLFNQFSKRVAIVGIGNDGHTAGIPALNSNFKTQNSEIYKTNNLVTDYNYEPGIYGERITLTFSGLEKMDYFILWVFGNEKNEALKKMFEKGSEEKIPGRFYVRKNITEKVILITDQKIKRNRYRYSMSRF